MLALLTLSNCGLGWVERKVIYRLDPTVVDPASVALPEVEARRFVKGGRDLMVWRAAPKPGKPTIIYLTGNAGNLANRAWRYRMFIDAGFGIVAPAYRGSSGSLGKAGQNAIIADTLAIYMDLLSGDLTGTPTRPIIYGESIGTSVAIHVNASAFVQSDPTGQNAPKAFVLEAPLTSIADVARDLNTPFRVLTPLLSNTWDSARYAPSLNTPLLVMHGTADPLIPYAQGKAVFEAAGSADKQLYTVPGATHDNIWQPDAVAEMFRFLNKF